MTQSLEKLKAELPFLPEHKAIEKLIDLQINTTGENNLVMCIGSSILSQGLSSSGSRFGYDAVGPMEWAKILSEQRFGYRNVAVSGQFTTQMLQRIQKDLLIYKPYVTVIQNGTNEIGEGWSSIWTNTKSMIDQALRVSQHVIVCSVQPRGGGSGWDQDDLETAVQLNELKRRYCENHPRLIFADLTKYILDPDHADGRPLSGVLRDATHWTAQGALLAGKVLSEILNTIFPPINVLSLSNLEVDGTDLVYGVESVNPSLAGTGGSVQTGCTGVAPDDWELERQSGTSSGALDGALIAPTDFDPHNVFELTFTPSGSAGTEEYYFKTNSANTALASSNDYYEALIGIEVDAWDGWKDITLECDDQGTGNKTIGDMINLHSQDFPDIAWKGIMRTPLFKTDGAIRLRLAVGMDGAASGTGKIRVFNPQIRRIHPDLMPQTADMYDNGTVNKVYGT